jgi:hypothetical protein
MLSREAVSNLAAMCAVQHRDLLVMPTTERLRDLWVIGDVMRVLAKLSAAGERTSAGRGKNTYRSAFVGLRH